MLDQQGLHRRRLCPKRVPPAVALREEATETIVRELYADLLVKQDSVDVPSMQQAWYRC